MARTTDQTCYYCKHLGARCGWQHWYCKKTDEDVDRNATCPELEEDS